MNPLAEKFERKIAAAERKTRFRAALIGAISDSLTVKHY